VSVTVEARRSAVTATIRPPVRSPWQRLVIRLRHPEGKPWQRVRVNGRPWTDADPARELVTLRPGPESFEIKVEY